MKILIVSDSHGDNEVLEKIYKKHPNVDLYLHAGDSQASKYQIEPFISCKGNCDHYYDIEEEIIMPTPIGPLMMKHIPYPYPSLLKQKGIKIYVFGHTHKKHFEIIDGIYFINPGSVSLPRDSENGTYIILDIDKTKIDYKFYQI